MPEKLTYNKYNDFNEDAKFFYRYFVSKGMSPVASAGIVGNLIQESTGGNGVNTNVTNSIGAYGSAQWLGSRKEGLFNYARSRGYDPSDKKIQAEFILQELNTTHKKALEKLNRANSLIDATDSFLTHFEKPGESERVLNKRVKYAESILNENNDYNVEDSFSWSNIQIGKNDSNLKDNTFAVLSILKQKFPDLKVTSTLRNSSQGIGKNSKKSRHNVGEAFDISHTNKNVYDYLNSYEGLNLLNRYGLGVLDETNPETMKKTGATGPHFHIGADSTLVSTTRNKLSSFKGVDINKDNNDSYTPYTSEFSDVSANELLSSFNSLKESIDKKNEQDYIKQKNEEVRNNLVKKQQERDFLLAQALSVNLPFVERKY